MAQDVRREVADVLGRHVPAAAQQREGARGVHEADRATRAGAELDVGLELGEAVAAGWRVTSASCTA